MKSFELSDSNSLANDEAQQHSNPPFLPGAWVVLENYIELSIGTKHKGYFHDDCITMSERLAEPTSSHVFCWVKPWMEYISSSHRGKWICLPKKKRSTQRRPGVKFFYGF